MQLVAILLVAFIGCIASAERTSPLLIWSNRAGLVGRKGQGAQVDYSVIDGDSRGSIVESIKALMGKTSDSSSFLSLSGSDAAPKHLSVVIFVGSHLDAAAMRKGAKSLSSILDSSAASLVMPYASCNINEVSYSGSHADETVLLSNINSQDSKKSLTSSLGAAGIIFKTVGCELDNASDDLVSDVSSTLSTAGESSQVLLICPPPTASLDEEVEQLLSVQEAVDASERAHVLFYLSEKINEEGPAHRRVLQTSPAPSTSNPLVGFGSYTTCGQLCQTQVRWLEGILTVLFMSVALSAGLTCLNVLNGPSKFDVQKNE